MFISRALVCATLDCCLAWLYPCFLAPAGKAHLCSCCCAQTKQDDDFSSYDVEEDEEDDDKVSCVLRAL